MGACILCGKSAGPFYSLHKNCYNKYENSNQEIANYLSTGLESSDASLIANDIAQRVKEFGFVAEAEKRTLNRALEHFASHVLEDSKLSTHQISIWCEVLDLLSPDETLFMNPHFLPQQYNLYALHQLKQDCLPERNRHPANYSITLRENEEFWWCFDKSDIEQDAPVESSREWSVLMQVVTSMLPKKRKASLEKISMGDGKLLITNQRIFFENNEREEQLELKNIYSTTPVKNGVRLQSKIGSSVPQTFVCEDARLLFGFIKYAQRMHE